MGKKFIEDVTLRPLKQLHFPYDYDLKNLAFNVLGMEQGNKVCFDQLNSIFAKN